MTIQLEQLSCGPQALSKLPRWLKPYRQVVVLIDQKVQKLHPSMLRSTLKKSPGQSQLVLAVKAGESLKSWQKVGQLLGQLQAADIQKDALLVAIGGGSLGDCAGMVAHLFKRGLNLIHVPTTILAMVDSSIGAKNAINLKQAKNVVGAYHPAQAVITDLRFLKTLPRRDRDSGMAEVIKIAMIKGGRLLKTLNQQDPKVFRDYKTLSQLIEQPQKHKQKIVKADPYDQKQRLLLNLGHTLGHAFESASHFRMRHGEAIALGLCAEWELAKYLNLKPRPKDWKHLTENLHRFQCFPSKKHYAIAPYLGNDKKRQADQITMPLFTAQGIQIKSIPFKKVLHFAKNMPQDLGL